MHWPKPRSLSRRIRRAALFVLITTGGGTFAHADSPEGRSATIQHNPWADSVFAPSVGRIVTRPQMFDGQAQTTTSNNANQAAPRRSGAQGDRSQQASAVTQNGSRMQYNPHAISAKSPAIARSIAAGDDGSKIVQAAATSASTSSQRDENTIVYATQAGATNAPSQPRGSSQPTSRSMLKLRKQFLDSADDGPARRRESAQAQARSVQAANVRVEEKEVGFSCSISDESVTMPAVEPETRKVELVQAKPARVLDVDPNAGRPVWQAPSSTQSPHNDSYNQIAQDERFDEPLQIITPIPERPRHRDDSQANVPRGHQARPIQTELLLVPEAEQAELVAQDEYELDASPVIADDQPDVSNADATDLLTILDSNQARFQSEDQLFDYGIDHGLSEEIETDRSSTSHRRTQPKREGGAVVPINSTTDPAASLVTQGRYEMKVSESQSLVCAEPIVRVSVEYPRICEALTTGSDRVLVIGRKPGQTRIAIWTTSTPNTQPRMYDIRVEDSAGDSSDQQLAARLTQTVRRMYAGAQVRIESDGDIFVVRGAAGTESTAKKIMQTVRSASLRAVRDEIVVR